MSKIKYIACTFTAFQTKLESADTYPLNLLYFIETRDQNNLKKKKKKTGTAHDHMGLVINFVPLTLD